MDSLGLALVHFQIAQQNVLKYSPIRPRPAGEKIHKHVLLFGVGMERTMRFFQQKNAGHATVVENVFRIPANGAVGLFDGFREDLFQQFVVFDYLHTVQTCKIMSSFEFVHLHYLVILFIATQTRVLGSNGNPVHAGELFEMCWSGTRKNIVLKTGRIHADDHATQDVPNTCVIGGRSNDRHTGKSESKIDGHGSVGASNRGPTGHTFDVCRVV